jgi:hypothetical protein
MFRKLLKSSYLLPLLLVGISALLACLNFSPNTWLTGWDTLHPEFNLNLNLFRVVFGVWRQEQGLGAVAGHSHMSELPRILFFYPLSAIFSPNLLRYLYFFVCLALGPLGAYWFLKRENNLPASFLGGLFYLLNLGTLQHFFVPFEMFATQYAFLPWLFFLAAEYLKEGKRGKLILFGLVTLLSAPMAYAATLWYVYFVALFLFLFSLYFLRQGKFSRVLIIILLTLGLNSFWLLPNLYFMATSSQLVSSAKINLLFSQRAFETDSKYATLGNAALLKGFLFDWQEFQDSWFVSLLGTWKNHLRNPFFAGIGYAAFVLAVGGVAVSIIKKKKTAIALIPCLLLAGLFLIHASPGINLVFTFLRNNLDIFREGLRFPWTKFSLTAMFGLSVFFGLTMDQILRIAKKPIFKYFLVLGVCLSLVVFMWPAFRGNLISKNRRTQIPEDYFQLYSWFADKDPNGRIGVFPMPVFWGWDYYRWGFEGAGFIWFGLKQPVLVRDFDRWNPYNENYYWETSYALYSKNRELFEKVMQKYQVKWLVVDSNLINPAWPAALFDEELNVILASSNQFALEKTIGNLKIYRTNTLSDQSVDLFQNLPSVGPNYSWTNYDRAFSELGNYFSNQPSVISNQLPVTSNQEPTTDHRSPITIYYPFRSLFTGRNPNELDFEISETQDSYIFTKQLPEKVADFELKLPEFDGKELLWLNPNDFTDFKYLIPQVFRDKNSLEVVIPKVGGYFSAELNNNLVRLTGSNGDDAERIYNLENLLHKYGYLIKVEAQNIEGNSLLFWVENLTAKRADIEMYLPKDNDVHYLIQPPMNKADLGYSLHFENVSAGRQKMVNELGKVTVNPIPFNFITGLKIVPAGSQALRSTSVKAKKVSHPNPSVYEIELEEVFENLTLILSQSFHKGWHAYDLGTMNNEPGTMKFFKIFLAPVFGQKIENHVLVNNWSNGWQLNPMVHGSRFIVLVFWPQYLEYLGFVVVGISVLTILFFTIQSYNKQSK